MVFNNLLRFSPFFGFLLIITFSFLNTSVALANSDTDELIAASNLVRDAKLAKAGKRVLMIEFSVEDCSYCRLLEEEFLKPMLRNAEYATKVVIRSISLTDDDNLVDFDGKTVSANELASKYGVFVAPTLLFLDENGVEVSEKLVGIWSVDFFGGFIDERINSARETGS